MLEAFETDAFSEWLSELRDATGKARIIKQVQRIQIAERYVGDWKPVGDVVEVRLFFGPGYRLYTSIENGKLLLLLVGGDKSSQSRDIAKAQRLLEEWREDRWRQ
jgi:putative addiction module killer protein